MHPTSILLLNDDINQRLVLTWHLVPLSVRSGRSPYDIASHCSRVAGCKIEDCIGRINTLMQLGVLLPDRVARLASDYVERLANERLSSLMSPEVPPEVVADQWVRKLSVPELREWLVERVPNLFAEELDWDVH